MKHLDEHTIRQLARRTRGQHRLLDDPNLRKDHVDDIFLSSHHPSITLRAAYHPNASNFTRMHGGDDALRLQTLDKMHLTSDSLRGVLNTTNKEVHLKALDHPGIEKAFRVFDGFATNASVVSPEVHHKMMDKFKLPYTLLKDIQAGSQNDDVKEKAWRKIRDGDYHHGLVIERR